MKLLVLGASSQVGLELVSLLESMELEFAALNTDELSFFNKMEVIKAINSAKPTQVVNAVSYTNLEKAETDEEAANKCDSMNSQGVSILAEVCDHLDLPLLHHSSSFVFDGQKHHPYTEEDETNPVCRYGLSKWYGERAIRDSLSRHIILRTDWVFSTHRNRFFRLNIDACKDNEGKVRVMENRFSPTPASDVARVIVAIAKQLDCNAEPWGTYHYCALQPLSQDQMVELFLREASQFDEGVAENIEKLKFTFEEVKSPYIKNSSLDCEKIKETFGIKQRSRAAGITEVLEDLYQSA